MNSWKGNLRLACSAGFLTLAMIGLGFRLAFLHLGPHERIRDQVRQSHRIEKKILAGRGKIYDCRGRENVLAMNLNVKDVCADPYVIVGNDAVTQVSAQLAKTLQVPLEETMRKLDRPERRFAYIRRFVPEPIADDIGRRQLPGIFFRDAVVRYYPQNSFMCHVLGFANWEGVGSMGIEQHMDRYLHGSPGLLESRVDALRRELYWERGQYIPAREGADVQLTIDQNIQYMVEKELRAAVEEHQAKGGWAIVENVRTGEILAMASLPAFDLNEFRSASKDAMLNRTIGYVYEPGSTFKVAVISAALDAGAVTPSTIFDCENGGWVYKNRLLRDYHPYGKLTVADGLKKSSNILAAKVALTLGEKSLYDYARKFGIGCPTGIDLPGEEAGILHSVSDWSGISATRIAIGQGVAVTALQMLGVISTIANDGFLMRPHVVKSLVNAEGSTLLQVHPEVLSRPIKPETAKMMRGLLARVCQEGGTGRRAAIEGYQVAGKTGTAQKAIAGGYSDSAYIASFVGFVPAFDPQVAAIIVIDEPQPRHTGGVVAAPVFGRVMGGVMRYLNASHIAPQVAQYDR